MSKAWQGERGRERERFSHPTGLWSKLQDALWKQHSTRFDPKAGGLTKQSKPIKSFSGKLNLQRSKRIKISEQPQDHPGDVPFLNFFICFQTLSIITSKVFSFHPDLHNPQTSRRHVLIFPPPDQNIESYLHTIAVPFLPKVFFGGQKHCTKYSTYVIWSIWYQVHHSAKTKELLKGKY